MSNVLIGNLIQSYQQRMPIPTILSNFKSECTRLFEKEFPTESSYVKAVQLHSTNDKMLYAARNLKSKYCYESTLLRNREYSFTKGEDVALPLSPENSNFSGMIRIVKCTIDGAEIEFDSLGDLLSERPFSHPLIEQIRRVVRYLVHSRISISEVQSGRITISELLLLLTRFYRIYIYDFGCRNTELEIEHPSVIFSKEQRGLPLLRRPSYEFSDSKEEGTKLKKLKGKTLKRKHSKGKKIKGRKSKK